MLSHEEILKQMKDALDRAIEQKRLHQELGKTLGPVILDALTPTLEELSRNAKLTKEEIMDAVSKIVVRAPDVAVPHTVVDVKIPEIIVPEPRVTVNVPSVKVPEPKVTVNVPEIKVPEIKLPKIVVPKPEVTVNVPPIKIPDLQWPKEKMPIEGWVQLMGVSLQNPLPVQIRDANGKPIDFGGVTQIMGGGGGKADYFTIRGFSQSAFADYLNADGRLKVSVETGGLTDTELRASAIPVAQVSGASWSTEAYQGGTWNINIVTGIGHGVKTVTVAGTDVVLATSTPCKRVTIQAQTDNTGLIAVGTSGVDATEATGTGIILYSGDALELDIDNLVDIYIDATVSGEGVRYTYFT